jgi:CHAT domain-containing protein
MIDEKGNPQDGFLRAHEVFNLKLPAELVVLSACQTGIGKEVRGEGLIGLTRGFMYAGAPRVIVSLWNVSDEGTSNTMARLYKGLLQQNLRPAAALRAAQIEMWKQKRWQAPYYWAAFCTAGRMAINEGRATAPRDPPQFAYLGLMLKRSTSASPQPFLLELSQ